MGLVLPPGLLPRRAWWIQTCVFTVIVDMGAGGLPSATFLTVCDSLPLVLVSFGVLLPPSASSAFN